MSFKVLIDNGIDIEFEIKNKKYTISKEIEKEIYTISSCTRYRYIGHVEYETEESDIYLKYKEWEKVEEFIKRMIDENGK